MQPCQSSKLPKIWLMTDPRFGDHLFTSIQKLPMRSGVILRHYDDPQRAIIYYKIAKICRRRGHMLIIAGAQDWQGARRNNGSRYVGRPIGLNGSSKRIILVGVHNAREIQRAKHARPSLYFLSPVFATDSHKGQRPLGILRFNQLAMLCDAPVIALGGMKASRASMIKIACGYAAIDGLIR